MSMILPKYLIFAPPFFVLLLVGCAPKPNYSNNNYQNNSIPAIQYDTVYRSGCNTAIFNTPEGGRYKGGFCYGQKSGSGVETYTNPPSSYDGQFKNNLRNGYGVLVFTKTGNIYKGYFVDGKQNGNGSTFIYKSDGSYTIGSWRNGVIQGEANYYSSNGTFLRTIFYKDGVPVDMQNQQIADTSNQKSYSPTIQKSNSDPSAKTLKCKRLGLDEGSEDFQLCLNSLKN